MRGRSGRECVNIQIGPASVGAIATPRRVRRVHSVGLAKIEFGRDRGRQVRQAGEVGQQAQSNSAIQNGGRGTARKLIKTRVIDAVSPLGSVCSYALS